MIIKKYPCTRFDRIFFGLLVVMAPVMAVLVAMVVGVFVG